MSEQAYFPPAEAEPHLHAAAFGNVALQEPQHLGVEDVTSPVDVKAGTHYPLESGLSPLDAHDVGGQQELMGVVRVDGRMFGLVRAQPEGAPEARLGLVEIRQTTPKYDLSARVFRPRFLGWVPEGGVTIGEDVLPELGESQVRVGAQDGNFTVTGLGNHTATLLKSDGRQHRENPFAQMPWFINPSELQPPQAAQRHVATVGRHRAGESRRGKSYEYQVGDNTYKLVGRDPAGYWVLTSTDQNGQQRHFVVYRSQSEGSMRVSQGREAYTDENGKPAVRLLKGAELSPDFQYTQDTQPHPEVLQKLRDILDTGADEAAVPPTTLLAGTFNEAQANYLLGDFAAQQRTLPITPQLHERLHRLRAGEFSAQMLAELAGSEEPRAIAAALNHEVAELNKTVDQANIIPDFSVRPDATSMEDHPELGVYASEVYRKTVNGRVLEWYMGRDPHGRVWVERIRFADSKANAYGTDAEVPYSGILTSKPLEYKKQASGLPSHLRRPVPGNTRYDDITPFLNELSPIKRYRATAVTPHEKLFHADGHVF